MQNQF
ncbi:hypothetical protein FWK35_00005664 [Aphis craccivora]